MRSKVESSVLPEDLTLDCSILRVKKHSYRKKIFSTRITNIYTSTLEICWDREEENYSKNNIKLLLGISDFGAPEARYHSIYRLNFENPLPEKSSKGRPISANKIAAFKSMCSIMKDEMKFFTLSEFKGMMTEQHENVYS